MSNQQSIQGILMAAVHAIRAEWIGTIDRPSIAVTRIEVEGDVNDALERGEA